MRPDVPGLIFRSIDIHSANPRTVQVEDSSPQDALAYDVEGTRSLESSAAGATFATT